MERSTGKGQSGLDEKTPKDDIFSYKNRKSHQKTLKFLFESGVKSLDLAIMRSLHRWTNRASKWKNIIFWGKKEPPKNMGGTKRWGWGVNAKTLISRKTMSEWVKRLLVHEDVSPPLHSLLTFRLERNSLMTDCDSKKCLEKHLISSVFWETVLLFLKLYGGIFNRYANVTQKCQKAADLTTNGPFCYNKVRQWQLFCLNTQSLRKCNKTKHSSSADFRFLFNCWGLVSIYGIYLCFQEFKNLFRCDCWAGWCIRDGFTNVLTTGCYCSSMVCRWGGLMLP